MFVLWSMGKDSSVLVWLIKKAFFGEIPFPVVHVDTTFKISKMIEYRNSTALKEAYDLRFVTNEKAIFNRETYPDGNLTRVDCCKNLKTKPLTEFQSGIGYQYKLNHNSKSFDKIPAEKFDTIIVGLRADEEGSRSKERYFSIRDGQNKWAHHDQPMELWDYYNNELPEGSHLRVHPLLDWSELDIWQYIDQENIPLIDLYFSDGVEGKRYRSLGCSFCSAQIESNAKSTKEVIVELSSPKFKNTSERSGRGQDKEGKGTLEGLRKDGYM